MDYGEIKCQYQRKWQSESNLFLPNQSYHFKLPHQKEMLTKKNKEDKENQE